MFKIKEGFQFKKGDVLRSDEFCYLLVVTAVDGDKVTTMGTLTSQTTTETESNLIETGFTYYGNINLIVAEMEK